LPPSAFRWFDRLYPTMLDLTSIARQLDRDQRIQAAYLLGSAVSGRLRTDSDLDIAILPAAGTPWSARDTVELATDLSLIARRNVDLGVLSSQNLVYAAQALLTGERFFCRDEFQTDLAAATLLGLNAGFRFERKEIVDAYAA
jgi:predicted nucleotidyltransferase